MNDNRDVLMRQLSDRVKRGLAGGGPCPCGSGKVFHDCCGRSYMSNKARSRRHKRVKNKGFRKRNAKRKELYNRSDK